MDNQNVGTATVVCVGGRTGTVRGVCARVKQSGHRAIAVITDVHPECTLPLLDTLSADVIIVSDDLPDSDGKAFTEALHRLYPDTRILLLAQDPDPLKLVPFDVLPASSEKDVVQKLSALFKTDA